MPDQRITDQREFRLLIVGQAVAIIIALVAVVFSMMRQTDDDLIREARITQKSQQAIMVDQAKVVTRLDGAIEEIKKSNRAVEALGKIALENQALAIAANERSKHNAERLRERGK